MGFRIMEKDKEKIVNALTSRILSDFEKVDKKAAEYLRNLLREGRVFFVLNPKTEVLKREILRTRYGNIVSETHGLTTTYYLPGSSTPLVHFIALPEERLFEKRNGKIMLKVKGVSTLVHELSHIMYPPEKADKIVSRVLGRDWLKIEGGARKKLAAEAIADVITVDFLLRYGREKEARAYLSGRKLTKGLRKKLVENALKQARKKEKEKYAARWREFMARAREPKVKSPRLLPGGRKEGAKRKAKAGLLRRLLRR